ncbi:protein CELLULOSE SYNTHASE INTERACTIVE 3 isoform X1 [Zingiber officinale]|uniref:protein CELLULOSE SYNTHASE INTERACTIVE 3 isoform X1 n=1 Tax=Zingiber officinale TaxID=94328 RepID=UPI001C4DBCCC|nr:protein CELLULOSE SYNTHASE INTERACTIVE 3 isoform X1 [Zingiber officinale]XP_042411509.1 protein CELLULOSE SYNTHASE INTERACTIVE 3 isoform X1 [Zingiber officinale]XP_042411511.1 protein CELLULOSE SYNTHASE INTERACTIVE 3 isoform X1 [Zingiber officinale]
MSKIGTLEYRQISPAPSSSSSQSRESNGMDDPEDTISSVARFLEQLHANSSSPKEKELITAHLLAIAKKQKDGRASIGTHSQAMPLLISVLRNGTPKAKVNVATILSALCKESDLRVKVLLGGCIPPLLSLLKSEYLEARKAAAEAIFEVSSDGLSNDHIGMKIFVTEGVVPTLWDLLNPNIKQDHVVERFVTGALRNLCGDKDGYWRATLEAGGVEIITGLLLSGNTAAQSNAASLLARLVSAFNDSIPKVIDAGAVKALLQLLGQDNDISVCASAADALEVLSSKSTMAKKAMVDAGGLPILIGAVVAPSKESMQGESGHSLQSHALCALANICSGMSSLILYLGELSQTPRFAIPVADITGALAYSLMVFESKEERAFDPIQIEEILMNLLKSRDNNKLVQDSVLEALASLYGNVSLSYRIDHSDAKRVLVGLITMASADVRDYLVLSLAKLCCDKVGIWGALGEREGIQLLIALLGLSSEQHQEYAVSLLAILTDQVDDSKWAITAAGGIPPLVQLLEIGSQKAKEDAVHVMWNLCCHSDDIRACVESTGAVPGLLWVLNTSSPKAQETSVETLKKLINYVDSGTINQLLALLVSDDNLSSKTHAIIVLGHVLTIASYKDLVQKGTPANKGLRSLVDALNSSNEETQECAASVLADLFSVRQDICDSLATDEIVHPCMKLLTSNDQVVATQSARALGALSRPTKAKTTNKMPYITEGNVEPLIKMAKTSTIDAAETAVAALANLLSDPQIAEEVLAEDVLSALLRVLGEGTPEGKMNSSRALNQLLNHFPVSDVLMESSQCRFIVHALADSLSHMGMAGTISDSLDVLAMLVKTKYSVNFLYSHCSCKALVEAPATLEPLVQTLAVGLPTEQDKVIEILSRLQDQPLVLGDHLAVKPQSIVSLAQRVMNSHSMEVRIGGTALLICAMKEHRRQSLVILDAPGLLQKLVYALVDMLKQQPMPISPDDKAWGGRNFTERNVFHHEDDEYDLPNPAKFLEGTVALSLLAIISSSHAKSKLTVLEAGGVEVLSDKLASYSANPLAELEENEGIWISSLLLAVLFQDSAVIQSSTIMRIIPSLAFLLKSDETIEKYFAAEALASLACNGNKGIQLAIANSGAVGGLTTLIGHVESDSQNLVALSEEFNLEKHPGEVVLNNLFEIEDVRNGATARKSIPLLVDLLRPMPDRPGAPPIAIHLLTKIAEGSKTNKLAIAEAGALESLTKYLSLSPQDSIETSITDLLRILYSNTELVHHEYSLNTLNQLIAVLRMGSRSSRYSAARTLQELFDVEDMRETEMARQAIQPLVDMLNSGSEKEQHAALVALVKLTEGNISRASALTDVEGNPLESLYKILLCSSSLELKRSAAKLCYVIFGNSTLRTMPIALECVEPLISLIISDSGVEVESGVRALDRLLDDEHHADIAAATEVVGLLVKYVSGSNYQLSEASISALIKLGKDRPQCKLEMVNAGIIGNALEMMLDAPVSVCSSIAELLRILTNNSVIAKSSAAAKIVEPLFSLLKRPNFTMWGQHSALQALVNILEKPQSLTALKLTPSQVIEPLISFLESPSQAIQQLGTELLSHLLEQEHFQQDITTKNAIVPLVQLAGIGILNLQQTAIKALESISASWPKDVADAGGIFELSKVIIQEDPQPSHTLWESAALVLSSVVKSNPQYYFKVSLLVLVKLLQSTVEATLSVALNALLVQERSNSSNAVMMAEVGAVDALLKLLGSHQCEEACGRLLEAIFNNARVREMKLVKSAITPLTNYLLDPQVISQPAKFLVTLALGNLFQHDTLARASASAAACHALITLLEDQPKEDMKVVAICALQSLVMHSRTNRRAVAEAGGILVIQELLMSQNTEVAGQSALLIKYLFSNHTLQEYVSNELIRSLTAALEKELWSSATNNEEVLRTIYVIFSNFKKLRMSEAATLCIPHLVGALRGSESAQESVLDTLCLLKESWPQMNEDIAKAQALIAAEAIPMLQMLMKTCPPSFQERAESLLNCLPGCLTVVIKRGNNLKQTMGSPNAFCQLKIGNGPPRETKVVGHSACPEWKEAFTWAFDVPPKGQKLFIVCKSKSTFGKNTLGRVTIQIDKVVTEGVYSGLFSLNHDGNRDGSSRTLEIEIVWSNRTSGDGM